MRLRAFAESARVGVDALRAHPMRTALSTLGIVIAVASLVATLGVFDGATLYVTAMIGRQTGIQTLQIKPRTDSMTDHGDRISIHGYPVFTPVDIAAAR